MGHHVGNESTSIAWTEHCNDLIYRITQLYPDNFAGVAQLPQSPGVPPAACIRELERCVHELGFIGCNLNPDPSGGYWTDPALGDRWWYPFYEKVVELDVPAMIHVSAACNPAFHTTGSHSLGADTTAVMQMITSDLFKDLPTIRFIVSHGGGAVPYHWGRFRGLADMMGKPPLCELILNNVYFDTCVYHQPGIDLLLDVIPAGNILFASEMVGAVRGIDPETGHYFDDTKRYGRRRSTERCGPDEGVRGQCAPGLHAAEDVVRIGIRIGSPPVADAHGRRGAGASSLAWAYAMAVTDGQAP